MKLFSKKSKQTTETKTEIIHLDLDDFPSKALELTYMDLMERYDKQPTDRLQKIMVQFSRELTSRSTDHVEPPKVQLSIKVEPKPEPKPESKPAPSIFVPPKPESNYEGLVRKRIQKITRKPEKISYNLNKDEQKRVAELIATKEQKSVQNHMIKKLKPKRTIGSFFKKKVPVIKPSQITIATELQNLPNIQQDANKMIQLEDKPKKLSIPFNIPIKELIKKKGYNLKGVELICECGHYLKAHQKGGISVGCQKCGCLKPIDLIAKRHGIILKLKDQSEKDESTIDKQAKLIQSMTQKPKPEISKPLPITEEQKEDPCTCDHKASEHYEGGFCYNCNCSKFSPYPQQVQEVEQVKKETPK